MELIDTNTAYPGPPHFGPQTQAQLVSCVPVVDYHNMRGGDHCSERFRTYVLFLGSTHQEREGFDSLLTLTGRRT